MEEEINKYKLVLIPCREHIPQDCFEDYNSAYNLWQTIWSETLKELDGTQKLYSNEFTRHDFASVLFKDGVAVSLACYSAVQLKLKARRDDMWFKSWPMEILNDQEKRDGDGLIAAWLCVDQAFRKSTSLHKINAAQIMAETFGKIILEEDYNVGYGTSRNNRGVNKIIYDIGGRKCGESIDHGCDVDLILIEPEMIRTKQLEYSIAFKYLWERRIDYRRRDNEQHLRKSA